MTNNTDNFLSCAKSNYKTMVPSLSSRCFIVGPARLELQASKYLDLDQIRFYDCGRRIYKLDYFLDKEQSLEDIIKEEKILNDMYGENEDPLNILFQIKKPQNITFPKLSKTQIIINKLKRRMCI